VEGNEGSIRLDKDYKITLSQKAKESKKIIADPPHFQWADPDYALAHSSMVACNRDILLDLLNEKPSENTGEENLKTMELVFSSYESALQNKIITPLS